MDYTKTPLTKTELAALLEKAGLKPSDAVRRKEAAYKKLGLDSAKQSEILTAMVEHPELIQRPIVEKGGKAVLARPLDALEKLL